MKKINHPGTLYIVATPIGNLKDISLRAVEVLQTVDCIAAEDTRHSRHLLQHLGIKTPLLSLHAHNEEERAGSLLERLQRGESIALISDAGTPLISDPGSILVKKIKNAGVAIVPIPGACALIAALSVSGLPTDRFIFEGFLPTKAKLRKERLEALVSEPRTLIFYEAPHRILGFLEEIKQIFGPDRQMVLARELTKVFETVRAGLIGEIVDWVRQDNNQQRGEIVVLIAGAKETSTASACLSSDNILKILLESLPVKQAVEMAAKMTNEKKNHLYERALQIKSH